MIFNKKLFLGMVLLAYASRGNVFANKFQAAYRDNLLCLNNQTDISGKNLDNTPAEKYVYTKPKKFAFIKNIPSDLGEYFKITFRKENILAITAMLAGTAVLVANDQYLFEKGWEYGDRLSISHHSTQRTFLEIPQPTGKKKWELGAPNDLGTVLYFIGDGLLHLSIAGSFLTYGLIKSDNRALQTTSQIVESMITSTLVVQFLKHTTGRETPNAMSTSGGKWRLLPNQIQYAKHVDRYDAMPSGHLATTMATVTVIAENYPESKFVRPVGYTLIALLSFQMVNNGVHWVSDYPLGLSIGYTFARIAVRRANPEKYKTSSRSMWLAPAIVGDTPGVKFYVRFNTGSSKNKDCNMKNGTTN